MQTIEYPNGDKYHGHLNSRGQRHGTGICVSPDGTRYDGTWKNDVRQGMGKCVWAFGPWYEGEWKDDMPDGDGKGILLRGQYFEGHLERGMPMGDVLMQVECVVADCPAAAAPLQTNQRVIPRELATRLGRPVGDCALFHATFMTPNYNGSSGMIEGTGTLADEANNGPTIHGVFREVGHELDMVEVDDDGDIMPPLDGITSEHRAAMRKSEQLERLAILRRARAEKAEAEKKRAASIAKGRLKLDKFRESKKKDHEGGHRKSRRMRNITRRRHCK